MKRGDIVLFDFPFTDRAGSELRPVVVVQADQFNQFLDDTIVAIITRTRRGIPTEVLIDITTQDGKQAAIRPTSVIDCKNLLTVDRKFIHTQIGSLSPRLVAQLDECLRIALGLS